MNYFNWKVVVIIRTMNEILFFALLFICWPTFEQTQVDGNNSYNLFFGRRLPLLMFLHPTKSAWYRSEEDGIEVLDVYC